MRMELAIIPKKYLPEQTVLMGKVNSFGVKIIPNKVLPGLQLQPKQMRWKNASDIRPYTLLSAWASIIPGVKTTDMVIEQGGNSVYGENNLTDPWNNYQIQRVQAGFNPVLVADGDYWSQNKLSDSNGNWPVTVPSFKPNTGVTRTLHIYNDTFSGTTVDVYWELRRGSATGTLSASGELHPTIALGSRTSQNISFTTPNVADGT